MPLTLPKKPKTLAQELKEKAQNDTATRETAFTTTLPTVQSLDTVAQPGSATKASSQLSQDLAKVYQISEGNKKLGDALFRGIAASTRDALSPYYSPYLQPTNSAAIKELNNLGVDTSKIDKEFFERNAWLKQYARTGMNGIPLAPDANSSREEKAGYYYAKLLNAENQTIRAETELAGLNREISYWAGRKDRNYSDEEIVGRIDWKKYPTLNVMRESKERGRPVSLNRSVDFNDDAVYGMLWSARNLKGSGSYTVDAMKYALGMGDTFKADPEIKAKLDPNSSAYNPYALGSTVDDAAEYFGMSGFNQKWLDDNQGILKSGNETAMKAYSQVYGAGQFTKAAEDENQKLSERLNTRLKQAVSAGVTIDANALLKDALFGLDTLQSMDEGLVGGDLAKLTRPVNYRWQDVDSKVSGQVQVINARQNAPHNPAELDIAARNEEEKVIQGQGTLIQKDAVPKSYTSFQEKMPGLWAAGLTKNPLSAGWYAPAGGEQSSFGPDQAQTKAIADLRKAGNFATAAVQGYDALIGSGGDISKLSTNEGAVRMAIDLVLDSAKAFSVEQTAIPVLQAAAARFDAAVNSILGIDPDAVAKILPQILFTTTVQSDIKSQASGTAGLVSAILRLGEGALKTVTNHVLGDKPTLQTAQTMFRVLKLRDMEKGTKSEAFQEAEAALRKAAGDTLQSAVAQSGHEELDDLTGIANQSSHNLDTVLNRWGFQGVNYIGNLLKAGRGDLAAAIAAMPTFAKSAIVAETNMRTFGLNDAAIAAQESALKADMKSPIVVLSAKQIAKQQAVEARKAELTAGGGLNVQSILVQKVNEAGKTVNNSKLALNQALRNEQAVGDALTKAQDIFHKNMADTAAADAVVAAIDQLQKATDARVKAQEKLKSGQITLNDAQQKLTDTQKQAAAGMDEQAKQDVEAMRMKLAEARAKLAGKVGGQEGEKGNVLFGQKRLLDIQNAAPDGSLHMTEKPLHAINNLQYGNGQPPMQSVDLFSYRPSLLAKNNGSGIINEGSQQLESDDATVTSDKGNRPFRALAASGAVTDVGYANSASTIGPQNKTSETTSIPSLTPTPSPTASTSSPDWMTVGAGNNPYSHMGIQNADYQAYLDGKLTEADLLVIANASEMYKEAGGSGNAAYMYQNEAHKRAADIREKYDPDYKKYDTYDYTHDGMYDQSKTEPMPNVPVFKTWTKLTTLDAQGGNQDGTIIDAIKNSPVGKAFSKAIEPIKENVEAGVQLTDFFKQYDSSSSARVQTILEDTRKKLNGKNLTAKDMLSIRDNARSAIDDTSMFQLIGNNVWYQDQAYPLYNPRDYGEGAYFGCLYDVEKINRSDSQGSFDWLGAVGGLKLEGEDDDLTKPYTKGQRNMIGAMNFSSILLNNLQVDDVKIMLMETENGEKRAVLQVGSSDRRKLMSEYAGTTQSYVSNVWLKGNGFGLFRALDSVAALYESVSGKKAGKWLDLKMTFDPKHEEEAYYGYIVGDEDGNLVCVSPIYPGDRLEIVNFWGKSPVYDLTDMINPVHIVEGGAGNLRNSFNRIEKDVKKDIEKEQSQK